MDVRFTKRIIPQPGESLSGFIMRHAEVNQFPMKYIMRYLSNFEGRLIYDRPYMLDKCPLKSETYEFLQTLTGINVDDLKGMTFIPMYEKFLDCIDSSATNKFKMDKYTLINDKRRFCPICLRKDGISRMIWQLADIEICDVHFVKLTSRCPSCGADQPYIMHDVSITRCFNCNTILYEQSGVYVYDKEFVNDQINKCKRWSYLLDKNTILVNLIDGISKEKSLAITFLYSMSEDQNTFDKCAWDKYFNRRFLYHLLSLIFEKSNPKRITISHLFDLLDKTHKDIDTFSKTIVPPQFLKSVLDYYNKYENRPNACCAPWCSHFGSDKEMKESHHREYYRANYDYRYMCEGCHIIYEYDKKSCEWMPVDNFVNMVCTVLPIIEAGFSKEEVIKITGIGRYKVNKIIGYILSHNLIIIEHSKEYNPDILPEDILEKFVLLLIQKGDKRLLAKKLFNWDENKYWFFLMHGKVQEFLFNNCFKYRRLKFKGKNEIEHIIKSEVEKEISAGSKLTISKICKNLKTSDKLIKNYGCMDIILNYRDKEKELKITKIQNEVEEFFGKSKLEWRKVTLNDLYKYIGITRRSILLYIDANLVEWIVQKFYEYKIEYNTYYDNIRIEIIKSSINKICSSGQTISLRKVSFDSGIGISILKRNKSIRKVIEDSMKQQK